MDVRGCVCRYCVNQHVRLLLGISLDIIRVLLESLSCVTV